MIRSIDNLGLQLAALPMAGADRRRLTRALDDVREEFAELMDRDAAWAEWAKPPLHRLDCPCPGCGVLRAAVFDVIGFTDPRIPKATQADRDQLQRKQDHARRNPGTPEDLAARDARAEAIEGGAS